MDKSKIMQCVRCIHFTNVGVGWCLLWKKNMSEKSYCSSFNWLPNERKNAGNEIEIGTDASLEEIDDLNGDLDETWATNIPCP